MKKNTKAFLGLVLGLVVIVGLTSVAFGQKGGRKQPPATWGVRIPAYGNLSGMGGGTHLYTNDDPNVNFSVTKEMTGQTVDYTSIRLFIFANAANDGCGNPLETYVSFFGVNFSELLESDEVGPGGVCGFPPCFNVGFPDCLPYFLNTDHPKQGYEHVLFGFRINADIDDETLFPMGQRVKYMGSGAITIYIWNSFDPITADDPYPYHTVTLHLANMCSEGDNGYYITRVDNDTWELNLEGQVLEVTQSYIWEEVTGTTKNKRPIIERTSYVPQSGLAGIDYRFVIVRNPK